MSEEPMLRRVYILTGDVQRVGFREIVKSIAIKLGVSGRVVNLPDESVEVVCEGSRELLQRFETAITIRKGLIRVERVLLREETPAEGGGPLFEVLRGAWQDELMERGDAAVAYLGALDQKTDITHAKLDVLGEKIDRVGAKVDHVEQSLGQKIDQVGLGLGQKVYQVGQHLGQKIDHVGDQVQSMHGDMNDQFNALGQRYDSIGTAANAMVEEIRGLRQDLRERDR